MNLSFKWVRNMAMLVFGIVLLVSCGKAKTEEPPQPTDDAAPTEAPSEAFELTPGTVTINEVMPVSDGEGSAWAEFTNIDSVPVPIAGAVLSDEDGNSYTFPAEAPMIQPGAFFVVYFDGEDSFDVDDEPFSFHTDSGMVDPFDQAGDQLALYANPELDPQFLVDFVAWGTPPEGEDSAAVEAGLWLEGAFTNSERGGVISGFSQPGESIGIFPGRPPRILDSWIVYAASETTLGEGNTVPTTEVMLPNTGALLLNQDFRLAWYNVPFAQEYQLQVDDDPEFGSPEVDLTLDEPYFTSAPADGTYYWRTKAMLEDGSESPFSPTAEFTVVTVEPLVLPEEPIEGVGVFPVQVAQSQEGSTWNIFYSPSAAPSAQANYWEVDYLNTLPPILQRKDSNLLCWDGDKELGEREPWDGPHADTPGNHSRHGRNYCARASIAMINRYYGGDLTQDRITYHHFGRDNWPIGDLGHDKPLAIDAGKNLLSWSLNNAAVNLTMGKPTFEQIQTWTRERRGVMSGIPGHAIALRGWAIYNGPGSGDITTGMKFVIYNDPWDGRMHLQAYNTMPITNTRVVGGTPTGRMQEASVGEDPDNDAIMTFDETNRFGTDPNKDDTDDDCIKDQFDMHSFLYTTHDSYTPSYADWDGDGKHKHVDSDNDNGGVIDGDEDGNWDGHLDAGETNNFDPADDARAPRTCRPPATPEPTATSGTIPPATDEPIDEVLIGVVATILFDDGGHGPFINMPGFFEILLNFPTGMVQGPFPWVAVTGSFDTEGNVVAEGIGTVAGFSNIQVTLEGSYSGEGFTGEYTMGTGGGLPGGFPITYYIEGQATEPEVEATPPSTVEATSTPIAEMPDFSSFYNAFNWAFENQDVMTLIDLLHPAVTDLYGAEACQAYLGDVVETLIEVQVVDVVDFGIWDWVIDGLTTPVEEVYTLSINVIAQGQVTPRESHVGLREDGTLGWFTDCGDPLG